MEDMGLPDMGVGTSIIPVCGISNTSGCNEEGEREMFCPKCGSAQSDDAAFCSGCGGPLKVVTAGPMAASQPKPKRGLGGVLTGVAAVAILGIGSLILWKGPGNSKAVSEAIGETPRAPAPVAASKGLAVLLNGLEAGSAPVGDMVQVADNEGALEFTRPNDRREVFGIPIESVRYTYHGGRLLWMISYTVTKGNAASLLAAMKREYGDPQWTDQDGFHHWFEPKGERKNFTLAAGYYVETSGEAGIFVNSGSITEKVVGQVMKEVGQEAGAKAAGANPASSPTTVLQSSSVPTEPEPQPKAPASPPPPASGHNHKHQPTTEPFTATFCCTIGPDRGVPLASCFQESFIRVRRGDKVKVYTQYDITTTARGNHSVDIDLPSSFQIEAQNTCRGGGAKLLLKVLDNSDQKIVFDQEAPFEGWLRVKN
jgi:hypothetical protein